MDASRPARPADLRDLALFGGLSDEQVADLATAGAVFGFELGDILFTEGQPAEYWWVLLSGTVDLIRHVGREDAVVAQMDVAGRWAGIPGLGRRRNLPRHRPRRAPRRGVPAARRRPAGPLRCLVSVRRST